MDFTIIRSLIDVLARDKAIEVRELACKEVEAAILGYHYGHTILKDGRRTKPSISEARDAMLKLNNSLINTKANLKKVKVSLPALRELSKADNAPIGRMTQEIDRAITSSETALKLLQATPDKSKNEETNILAWQIACVFRHTLGIKPTSTRDNDVNITKTRNGAAYARVLRESLKMVGRNNVNIRPILEKGLAMLKDETNLVP